MIRIWPEVTFFDWYFWSMFNNLGLALGMALMFYTSVEKRLKPYVKYFLGLISTTIEARVKKLVGRPFWVYLLWIELGSSTVVSESVDSEIYWSSARSAPKKLFINHRNVFLLINILITVLALSLNNVSLFSTHLRLLLNHLLSFC